MDIVEFMTARLDEDQASAEAWEQAERTWQQVGARNLRYDNGSSERVQSIDIGGGQGLLNEQIWVKHDYDGERTAHIARHDPARVLADIAAKRRLLEAAAEMRASDHWGLAHFADVIERSVAAPYDAHPDFNPAWRVE